MTGILEALALADFPEYGGKGRGTTRGITGDQRTAI
jgi:hypothetical protein